MEKEYLTIKENLDIIKENIAQASKKSVNGNDVILLGATKMNSADRINYAISQGLKYIGENKVQELLDKYEFIDKENTVIHFIGHLQSNKVKYIIDKVDMIQSLDSVSLAKEIDKQAKKHNKVMEVLVEINACNEESKSGISVDEVEKFLEEVSVFEKYSSKKALSVKYKETIELAR